MDNQNSAVSPASESTSGMILGRIADLKERVTRMGSDMAEHADALFGGNPPTGVDLEVVDPSGRIPQINAEVESLAMAIDALHHQLRRFDDL